MLTQTPFQPDHQIHALMQNGQNQWQLTWTYNAKNQMTAYSFHAQPLKHIIPSLKHTLA